MSEIDLDTTKKVAYLARIALDDAALAKISPQLDTILDWVNLMDEVDTSDVEPLQSVVGLNLETRPDDVNDGNCQEDVLANAPESTQGFYVVQKVVE